MDNLAVGTKRFRSLLDEVAAGDGKGSDASNLSASVGDDSTPGKPMMLGPSVGDDAAPSPTNAMMLGPSVGDDGGASDVRLKHDLRYVGTTVFGLPLYHFKYLGKPETYEGVMAQEVLQVMPAAVSVAADGYYRVNYRALGTSMRQVS
ncbi:MAG: tail fiber domain-containing protein [Terriglobales bacterium]